MPSPFPGMDPYLEDAALWLGVHSRLIAEAGRLLQPQLRARGYYVDIGERVWLAEPERAVYPDLAVLQRPVAKAPRDSAVAILEVDEPVRISRADSEVRETYLEIYDQQGHRVITGIEVISPANKSDTAGRELYERKQVELREAGVHLVEIDLLRGGRHIVEVPSSFLINCQPWDYLVNISRANHTYFDVYPIRLRSRLPRIRIPLKAGDEDAVLDLQAVFNQAYDTGPYPDRVNYQADPVPPLAPDDDAWARQLLQDAGLRVQSAHS